MRLWFVRHGESEANVAQVFSNRGWQHGLTPRGRQQAQALACRIEVPVQRIYASPLMRAVQTAEILSAAWGISFEVADALREFDCGELENMPISEEAWSRYVAVMADWLQHGRPESRLPGGESLLDIQARFKTWVDRLVERYGDQDVNLVCVGHGGTYRAALPAVLINLPPGWTLDHHLGNTEYALSEYTAQGLVCRQWGEGQGPISPLL